MKVRSWDKCKLTYQCRNSRLVGLEQAHPSLAIITPALHTAEQFREGITSPQQIA